VALGLFAGVDIDSVPAAPAPDKQHEMRPRRAAEADPGAAAAETARPAEHAAQKDAGRAQTVGCGPLWEPHARL
jgi:hypothetical protein